MLALTAAGALALSATEAVQALVDKLPPCVHKLKGVRSFIALEVDGESTQARSCLLKQLTGHRGSRSASAWALAAAILPDHASIFAGQARSLIDKGNPNQRHPTAYDIIGPMCASARERTWALCISQ